MRPGHKRGNDSRERIVQAASRLFRERGYRDTSVDDLMAEAGLTRGAFYAHFESKAALLQCALEAAFEQSRHHLLGGALADLEGARWLSAASERYLSLQHMDHADFGCAIPALGAEVARAPEPIQRTFTREVEQLLGQLSGRLGGEDERARAVALRHLAAWVGAITLARAVDEPTLAEEILESVRRRPSSDEPPT